MKGILLKTLLAIGVAVFGFLLAGILLPSFYQTETSVDVGAPPDVVFGRCSDFEQWQLWNPWAKGEEGTMVKMSHPSGGTGAWCEWKSKRNGKVLTTITYNEKERSIYYRILYNDRGLIGIGALHLDPEAQGTRVSWRVSNKIGLSPMKRWSALLIATGMDRELDRGLAGLKRSCEKNITVNNGAKKLNFIEGMDAKDENQNGISMRE
jgi:hypothetical protein